MQLHVALDGLPEFDPPCDFLNETGMQQSFGIFGSPEEQQLQWETCRRGIGPDNPFRDPRRARSGHGPTRQARRQHGHLKSRRLLPWPLPHPDHLTGPNRPGPKGFPAFPLPIGGLYLGRAGCPGGPGITFVPGYTAAYRVLEDRLASRVVDAPPGRAVRTRRCR